MSYAASNWYWIGQPVGYSSPIIYSSAAGALITEPNTTYDAWKVGNVATPWPKDATDAVTTAALDAVLTTAGLATTGLTALTQAQLLAYAENKIATLLATPRPYTVAGLSGPVVDDCGIPTGLDMDTTWARLATLTYPFEWSDDNYAVWSMTQVQLTAFLTAAFAYASSVWAFANGTAFPGITGATITTTAQVNALAWPT